MHDRRAILARLPKTDRVLQEPALERSGWRRAVVKRRVQVELQRLREEVLGGRLREVPDAAGVARAVAATLERWARPRPRRVVNATGVVLHTNLGRAPLARRAIDAMVDASGYCDLELDLVSGKRGSRFDELRPLGRAVLEADDVHVVNNNAAALLLACTVLGGEGGVALSLGQMVEIGDGFRVATMAAAGGCRVVGVGSTNRTHPQDFAGALQGTLPECEGRPVRAVLWVHRSNFRQEGFVGEVSLRDLAEQAHAAGVPLVADLGSGSLGTGLSAHEPTIADYLSQGADLVLCSGDKLLGGPQAGIIAGRADLVERCRRHPMARALRPDKTTLAALHATLVAHGQEGVPSLPLHTAVGIGVDTLEARARSVVEALGRAAARVIPTRATIGGGSLPGDTLESRGVAVTVERVERAAAALRERDPPVVGRIEDGRLILDLRTVDPADDPIVVAALRSVLP